MMKALILFIGVAVSFAACAPNKSSRAPFMMGEENFKDDAIAKLKATKTVFFYQKENGVANDSLEKAISEAWTLTPIIFDDFSNANKYAGNPAYSYFVIEGVKTTVSRSNGFSYSNIHYYLALNVFKEVTKKGKVVTDGLYRIELFPNFESMMMGDRGKKDEVIDNLYAKGQFYNWSPVSLKACLATSNTNLTNKNRPWLFQNIKDANLSQLLSHDTLYVPKRLLIQYNSFTGKEKDKEENVFGSYRYKYRLCTDAELYQIFEVEKRGRFLFEYVKSSTDKFVTVYDLKEKKAVYRHYAPMSYNLKGKDVSFIR
ncbi:hypothetical protein HHL16_16065 [Pseudoflavitalea sp. G-6-1-2]|uniref:hypothetical protein n=1 Tax=Pseudoflavitalea sp. G-6-1-2 TaxID=2728841 RepID=UPI00146A3A0F|nr:hypothetical protein [Pseudoflavitalea sp. G-6-1-2]NML22400.1 hypothetical protein [Pseudoflavitalea sp. G-6-1-2]